MAWRGSGSHLDANVPDYQKVIQGRSSTGWSSTQSSIPSYSSRFPGAYGHPGSYISPRNHSALRSGGYNSPYQPSKYGVGSEPSLNTQTTTNFRNVAPDGYNTDSDYMDRTYGFRGREFDLEPYRSPSHRVTDYSSDSGRGHVSHRTTDYSSDSGMSYRQSVKSNSDLELEIPSPDTSRSQPRSQNDDTIYSSPVKSKMQVADYYRRNNNQIEEGDVSNRSNHLGDFRNLSRSEPNLDDFSDKFVGNGRIEPESETSPRIDDSTDNIQENGIKHHAEDEEEDLRGNFTSPSQYQGDIENLTFVHRNNVKVRSNKVPDLSLTDWQQKQRNAPSLDNNRLALKPPSPRTAYSKQKSFRDYAHHAHSDTELSNHCSPHHHSNSGSNHDNVSPRYNQPRHNDSRHGAHGIHDSHTDTRHNDTRHTDTWHIDTQHSDNQLNDPRHNRNLHDMHSRPQVVDRYTVSSQMNHLSAADAIIREKNAIIEELNERILGYEESQREYEMKLRNSQMGHSVPLSDGSTFLKMKDLEYDNKDLRSNMAKMELQKNSEIDSLEIKLGGVEHELTQLKEALRQTQPTAMEMQKQLQDKNNMIEELKRKNIQTKERADKQRDKLERMERYLSDLPTLEDFTKNAEELAARNEEVKLKTEHISDLEERLSETTQQLADSEATVHGLEGKVRQLAGKMRELSSEIHHIKTEGEGKALADTQEELAETKEIKDKVIHDLEKAKKLLETNHRKLRQMEAKHVDKVRDLQERLGQEEESVMALREEVRLKEEQVAKLKKSLKEFANKNQDLMDEALVLKEQLRQFEQTSMDETQKLQRRFVREMGICFSELQPLVQIMTQQAEGREPDISLLLGTTTSLDEEGAVGGSLNNDQSLKHCFVRLRELRGEVEKVKNTICNKYARDMGDNLKCATQ